MSDPTIAPPPEVDQQDPEATRPSQPAEDEVDHGVAERDER